MDFLKKRWPLFIVAVVFVLFKLPHLHVAFYWDESWPYVAAVKAMYQNGISLLPGAIDSHISRGHPLFFHASAAAWMQLFGTSNFSLHCFALTISVLLLVAIYEAGLRVFNMRVAVIAVLLVATNVAFFVRPAAKTPALALPV